MARRVENWVQEQVDMTVYGRLRPRIESTMEDPVGHDPAGFRSTKSTESKKLEAAAEQRKLSPRTVKGSGKSDRRELRSRPTKRKREESSQVATQQERESHADDAGGEGGKVCRSPQAHTSGRTSTKRHNAGFPQPSTSAATVGEHRGAVAQEIFQQLFSTYIQEEDDVYIKLEKDICGRFSNTKIEVSSWSVPRYVHVVSIGERERLEEKWAIRSGVVSRDEPTPAVPPDYKKKWTDIEDKIKAEQVNFVLSHVRGLSTGANFLSCKYNTTKSFRPAYTWAFEKKEEVEANMESNSGEGLKTEKTYLMDELYAPMVLHFLSSTLRKSMLSAYIHSMTSGKGRRFVKNLLEIASLICCEFGLSRSPCITVVDNVTSPVKGLGFPVVRRNPELNLLCTPDQLPRSPGCRGIGRRRMSCCSLGGMQDDANTGARTDADTCSDSDACSDSDTGSETGSNACKKTAANQEIYPECVVMSRDESGFPRHLLVAEISSASVFGSGEKAQLYRVMLGGGMHQTEVFGLLINAVQACIVRMQMRKREKLVTISENLYDFTPVKGAEFNVAAFDKFFRDLVAVLDYSNKEISELK